MIEIIVEPPPNLAITVDTNIGVAGTDGANGASAYEIAVQQGFSGTEVEWLASLVGPQGDDGTNGTDGADGDPGPANVLTIGTVTEGPAAATITGTPPAQELHLTLPRGAKGDPGDTGLWELRGTGMPEGVVTASPGAYYTDTAQTNGALRWVKQTGTGNTGWRCIVGDTGWRYLDPTWFPNHANSEGLIRRVNNRVEFVATIKTITYNALLITVPAGFRGVASFNVGGQAKLAGLGTNVSHTVHNVLNTSPAMVWGGDRWTFHGINVGTSGTAIDLRMRAEWLWSNDLVWPTTQPGAPTLNQ